MSDLEAFVDNLLDDGDGDEADTLAEAWFEMAQENCEYISNMVDQHRMMVSEMQALFAPEGINVPPDPCPEQPWQLRFWQASRKVIAFWDAVTAIFDATTETERDEAEAALKEAVSLPNGGLGYHSGHHWWGDNFEDLEWHPPLEGWNRWEERGFVADYSFRSRPAYQHYKRLLDKHRESDPYWNPDLRT